MKCRRTKTWIDERGEEHRDIVWFGSYGLNTEGSDYEVFLENEVVLSKKTYAYQGITANVGDDGVITVNGKYSTNLFKKTVYYNPTGSFPLSQLVSEGIYGNYSNICAMSAGGYYRGDAVKSYQYSINKIAFNIKSEATATDITGQPIYYYGLALKLATTRGSKIKVNSVTGTNLSPFYYTVYLKDDLHGAGESVIFNGNGNGRKCRTYKVKNLT